MWTWGLGACRRMATVPNGRREQEEAPNGHREQEEVVVCVVLRVYPSRRRSFVPLWATIRRSPLQDHSLVRRT
jgi:hypothetical protein